MEWWSSGKSAWWSVATVVVGAGAALPTCSLIVVPGATDSVAGNALRDHDAVLGRTGCDRHSDDVGDAGLGWSAGCVPRPR